VFPAFHIPVNIQFKILLHTVYMIECVSFYSGKLLKSHNREESSSDNSSDSDVPTYTEEQRKVYNHILCNIYQ